MNAALLRAPRSLVVTSLGPRRPGPGDVIIGVSAAGVCGTDYRIWTGDRPVAYPRVLGHEFLGHVRAVGPDVTTVRMGDRVVVEPNYGCTTCPPCRDGNRNLCQFRTTIGIDVDGGFSEEACVPARCCWRIPDGVADMDAVLTEPLAVVVRAVARAAPATSDSVAVIGLGTLGLLAVQLLKRVGMRVLAVGRTATRSTLARELGADGFHAAASANLGEVARSFSGRDGVSAVVETAGTAAAVAHAIDLVRAGGRIVLTGLPHEPTPLTFSSVVRREVTITGSMIYQDEFGEALRLIASGEVVTAPLVTHRFPLADIGTAFTAHRDAAAIKVALVV